MNSNYTYSSKAHVFRKSYNAFRLTVILEELDSGQTTQTKKSIQTLKDEIHNFLNDAELEQSFRPEPSE